MYHPAIHIFMQTIQLLYSFVLLGLMTLVPLSLAGQLPPKSSVTLSGVLIDQETGEQLTGANVKYVSRNSGVVTNAYGFFALTGTQGNQSEIEVTHIGYSTYRFSFAFDKDTLVTILIQPNATVLDELSIEGDNIPGGYSYQAGRVTMTADKIHSMASFGGESDVMKSLQFLPGVQTGNEGTANMSVRGGSFDQNLILLDEAPVYNPAHALSFFSIFNTDALKSVDFYRSGIPVQYGGRLSSVVDIRMKEGNRHQRETRGAIGVISSKLTTEGPLGKNENISYMLSGRYSYAGQIVNVVYFLGQQFLSDPTANKSTTDNKINFYDLNAKINWRINSRNQLFLSGYSGSDQFYFNHITSGYALAWGNQTLTMRWNHLFTKKLFANSTFSSSRYRYQYSVLNNTQYFLWSANLDEKQLKQDYDWYVNEKNHIVFGFDAHAIAIDPGRVNPRNENAASKSFSLEKMKALNGSAYVGATTDIRSRFQLKYGLRYGAFGLAGNRTAYIFTDASDLPSDSLSTKDIKLRWRLEPRLSIRYMIGKGSMSFSYDRTLQFMHLLANSSVGLPTDIWWPSTNNIKPQSADIFAFSYEREISRGLRGNIAAFFKSMNGIVDFRDNAKLFVNKYLESQILQGTGTSYGAEVLISKQIGKLIGSVSYTYSKSYNTIDGINNGKAYPNRYDKRHNVAVVLSTPVSERITLNSNVVFTTGGALTVPDGSFIFDGVAFNAYGDRGNYRLPAYHRLDVSLRYENRKKNEARSFKHYWVLDVYNMYGRKNPFTLYSLQTDNAFYQTRTQALYLYRIVPTLTYNFQF